MSHRHTCRLCNACVRVNECVVICCDNCDAWFHISCARINSAVSRFDSSRVSWICERCDSSNFSQTLFSSSLTFEYNNHFSPISDLLGEPVACSSPVSFANSHKADISTTPRGPLKVLTANVNHFIAKQLELKQSIIDNDFDIVIARETKIDNSVQDAELGLDVFDVYRQDRNFNEGGVLVVAKKILKSVRLDITTMCELVVVKLLTENSIPAVIG